MVAGGGDAVTRPVDGVVAGDDGSVAGGDGIGVGGVGGAAASRVRREVNLSTNELTHDVAASARWRAALTSAK